MKNLCFVNGSPKLTASFSGTFIDYFSRMLDPDKVQTESVSIVHCLKNGSLDQAFARLLCMDILVFVFPLYIDSIPSSMLEFLDGLQSFAEAQGSTETRPKPGPAVYAVVNCGFIEGTQTGTALKIMEHFSDTLGFDWRFGIGVGAGEFMRDTQNAIPLESKLKHNVYQALYFLKSDIEDGGVSYETNRLVNPSMPKRLFIMFGDKNWIAMAKRNGLQKKELYTRPYGR